MTGQFLFSDRTKDTSSAQSSTVITLSNSPPTGFQSFNSGIGDGNFCFYLVSDGTHWEVTYGVYTNLGTTLARAATPYSSSNSGSQVTTFSGTVTVACVDPSALMNGDISMIGAMNGFYRNVGVNSFSTGSLSIGNAYFSPIWIKQPFSSYSIQIHQTVGAGAGGICDMGLYSSINGAPNALLGTGQSNIAITGTGAISTSSIPVLQPQMPGLYYACYLPLVSAGTMELAGLSAETFAMEFLGCTGALDITTYIAFRLAGQSSLPNPAGAGTALSVLPPYICVSVSL